MAKVYIVEQYGGEYEDAYDWNIAVFSTEQKAKEFIEIKRKEEETYISNVNKAYDVYNKEIKLKDSGLKRKEYKEYLGQDSEPEHYKMEEFELDKEPENE